MSEMDEETCAALELTEEELVAMRETGTPSRVDEDGPVVTWVQVHSAQHTYYTEGVGPTAQ